MSQICFRLHHRIKFFICDLDKSQVSPSNGSQGAIATHIHSGENCLFWKLMCYMNSEQFEGETKKNNSIYNSSKKNAIFRNKFH